MRIDTHVHVWSSDRLDGYHWMTDDLDAIRRPFSLDDLEPDRVAAQVEGIVLVQTEHTEDETIEMLHHASAAGSPVVGVVGWVDLTAPDVAERITALRSESGGDALVGIRHLTHDEPDPLWLDRSDVRRGLAALGEVDATFDLLVRLRELPAAQRVVADLPTTHFILDHAAKPPLADGALDDWEAEVRRLAVLPNVACKLSGLATEAAWDSWRHADYERVADVVFDAFGSDRVMFGSDWPVATLTASYGEVFELASRIVPPDLREQVFRVNAQRWYGLTTPGSDG